MRRSTMLSTAVLALGLAGCGGDLASQLVGNEQLRNQVLGAIVAHKDIALQTVDRILASDSLRSQVVDHILQNDEVAKQVIVRIATNPSAFDMVMGAAVHDSSMRAHVITLVKGISMASGGK